MPEKTATELLDETNAAISQVLTKAQSTTGPERSIVFAELDKLRLFRKELQREVRVQTNTARVADVSGT